MPAKIEFSQDAEGPYRGDVLDHSLRRKWKNQASCSYSKPAGAMPLAKLRFFLQPCDRIAMLGMERPDTMNKGRRDILCCSHQSSNKHRCLRPKSPRTNRDHKSYGHFRREVGVPSGAVENSNPNDDDAETDPSYTHQISEMQFFQVEGYSM